MSSTRIVREALGRTLDIVQAGWTQGSWARDRWSHEVDASSRRACRFCLQAAVNRATRRNTEATRIAVQTAILNVLEQDDLASSLIAYNDTPGRKKSEVLSVIRQARKDYIR